MHIIMIWVVKDVANILTEDSQTVWQLYSKCNKTNYSNKALLWDSLVVSIVGKFESL